MLVRVRRFSLVPMRVLVRKLCLELRCVRLMCFWLELMCFLVESSPFESFWPDTLLPRMPSLEAACPFDILVLEPVALAWVPACASAPAAAPFSAAQEGVAAAKAIAPTT